MSATHRPPHEPYRLTPLSGPDSREPDAAGIWLDGDVLACACPDCGTPMSIRLWLMVADCFRCGATVELTEEQEREALRLLREQENSQRAEVEEAAGAIQPTVGRTTVPQRPAAPTRAREPEPTPRPAQPPPPNRLPASSSRDAPPARARPVAGLAPAAPAPARRRVPASEAHRGARKRVRELYDRGGMAVFLSRLLADLPAWLVSLVFHVVVLLLLAMWYDKVPEKESVIILATAISQDELVGEQPEIEVAEDAFEFDDPGAIELDEALQETGLPEEPEIVVPPRRVSLDLPQLLGRIPDLTARPVMTVSAAPAGRMFAGRAPEVRAQQYRREGGTTYTEAAVARALKYLARHQRVDGSWSLEEVGHTPDCDATCTGGGSSHSDVAATALALLPFLGAGQTHAHGRYTDEVVRGLNWLVSRQKPNGDLRGDGDGRMYAHGQATIALCEAYALTGDEQLREPAQAALDYIVQAQHHQGGWRYEPKQAGDTSVVGWQLMALKSGQMANLRVPPETFESAGRFLDRVKGDAAGSRYRYQPGRAPDEVMTAEALLCRQYLGWAKDHPGLRAGVEYLLDEHPPRKDRPNIYYWYYATQVLHHMGGSEWDEWNEQMRQILTSMQDTEGHAAGSWSPVGHSHRGGFADRGGRIYMTSLAACILEVYYRHMPIYREQAVEHD